MITNIHLHPNHQTQLNGVDILQLLKQSEMQLPYPLSVSFGNFHQALIKGDKTKLLHVFVNDLTTSIFQFLSLILASEYILSTAPRGQKIYQAIENMTYRPGPGKWLAFLREFYHYQKDHSDSLGIFSEIIFFIEKHEIKKKSFSLTVEENHGMSPSKKLGLLELMVTLRNNVAHSKGFDTDVLSALASSVLNMTALLLQELSFMNKYNLYITRGDNAAPLILRGADLPDLNDLPEEQCLIIERGAQQLRLSPLFINDKPYRAKSQDIYLLESLDNKKIFYSGSRLMSEKNLDNDNVARQVVGLLKSIYVEPQILGAGKVSTDQFRSRVLHHSEHMLSEYVINGKYNEDIYIYPEAFRRIINNFYSSDKKVMFLSDDQGSGKSALCAHLANEFISAGNSEHATFLLDARLLEDLGRTPMLFEKYITRQLGIEGELYSMLMTVKGERPSFRFTLIIDNLNEYFLKGADQSFLIEQLIDFAYRHVGSGNIRIIAIARPEYYKRSIEKYMQSFEDKIIQYTFSPPGKIVTLLPLLPEIELEQIWSNYSSNYTGYTPKTSWADLDAGIKKHCRTPLVMIFLLRHYDNKCIPAHLTYKDIKKQYIQGILEDKDLKETLFGLIKKMHKEQRPYLLTETFSDKEIRSIADSSYDTGTGLPLNNSYNRLTSLQILREEKVMKEELVGKKITVNNELTQDLISEEFRKFEANFEFRSNLIMSMILLFFIIIPLFFASNNFSKGFYKIRHAESIKFSSYGFTDKEIGEQITAGLSEIFYKNYPLRFHIASIIGIYTIIGLIIWFLFLQYIFLKEILVKKRPYEKKYSFFDLLFLKFIQKSILIKLIRFITPIGLSTFFLTVALAILKFKYEYKTLNIIYLLLVIFIISVVVYLGWRVYLYMKKDSSIIKYMKQSTFYAVRGLMIPFIVFILLLMSFLYYSPNIFNYTIYFTEQHYSAKFMEDISQLTEIAEQQELEYLADFIDKTDWRDDHVKLILMNVSSGIKHSEVDLLSIDILDIKGLMDIGRNTAVSYWWLFLLILILAPAVPFLTTEIPARLARRKQHSSEKLEIL